MVPDMAKPTALEPIGGEGGPMYMSARLVRKVQSDRLLCVWIWVRLCGKSRFQLQGASLAPWAALENRTRKGLVWI